MIHKELPWASSSFELPPDKISNSVPSGDISAGRGLATVVGIVEVSPPFADTWTRICPTGRISEK
jgi:hypothetical protein